MALFVFREEGRHERPPPDPCPTPLAATNPRQLRLSGLGPDRHGRPRREPQRPGRRPFDRPGGPSPGRCDRWILPRREENRLVSDTAMSPGALAPNQGGIAILKTRFTEQV